MTSPRALLLGAFHAALADTDAARLTRAHLPERAPAAVLAFGKAAGPMLSAALERFPALPFLAVLPGGAPVPAGLKGAQGEVLRAAHPTPDRRSVHAARRALAFAGQVPAGEALLVLGSGGGSALLCAPAGVTLAQKAAVMTALMRAGADIHALNTVRRHLSHIKGGQLAQVALARGAQVTTLLLSDVVGDDPAVIASGPTVLDPTTFTDALAVLDRFGLEEPAVRAALQRGLRGERPETPSRLPGTQARVIGSNALLLKAAAKFLSARGVTTVTLGDTLTGEARDLAAAHARQLQVLAARPERPLALLSGGEATVTVRGPGRGGRNHEFLLALALKLGPQPGVWGLAAGSDGVDGSSGAAGALLTPDTLTRAAALKLSARAALRRNDSGPFFAALNDQLVTGPTGQNLNDLRMLLLAD